MNDKNLKVIDQERFLRAVQLHHAGCSRSSIANELGVSRMTVGRWIERAISHVPDSDGHSQHSKLDNKDLIALNDILREEESTARGRGQAWTNSSVVAVIEERFGVRYNPNYVPRVLKRIQQALLNKSGSLYYSLPKVSLYLGEAEKVLCLLPENSVDCIVTSPPYYGQRDYGVPEQLGLEPHPQQYIERLVKIFEATQRVLKPTGSLWVNIGDTYWSGKGTPHYPDQKQKHRRFTRPQDRSGPRPLCSPKQLLLIPHRFAIAMQDKGWIVRNDNVWHKVNPTPDPVDDRSAAAHEYIFHFVRKRHYYYNFDAVAVPSSGANQLKPPSSVWSITSAPSFKKHVAVFPEAVIRIPIMATLPPNGVLLDPFCGSGTTLDFAVTKGQGKHAIGIDISRSALDEAKDILSDKHKEATQK